MKILQNKSTAITLAMILVLSIGGSTLLLPNANAHSPAWSIPTYAYINVSPNPIGVGQSLEVYMWLDCVYGAAGASMFMPIGEALLSNTYRFTNYELFITAPDGKTSEVTFPTISDTTSAQQYAFTPTATGTYTFNFTYPGQVYGANGNGSPLSPLMGDSYAPSFSSATLTVQQEPIASATTSEPLPSNYWSEPIYGENTNWYTISSNWLGLGAPVPSGYTSTALYHGDAVGPLTAHVMWTTPTQNGGIVGGNLFPDSQGAGYFEGSAYAPRYYNPIVIDGYLYYTQVASFTGAPIMGGSATGPTICVNLRTGQQLWSNPNIPSLSFGYIYNVEDPDQHGVYPPILVATVGSNWNLYDGFTGDSLFNVTNVPTGTTVAGPNGEQIKYVFNNIGTPFAPEWYLAQWNSSRLWLYDINPYTSTGSLSPSIILSDGALLGGFFGTQLPVPVTGESTLYPNGASGFVPYGAPLTVNGSIGIAEGKALSPFNSPTTYDWNISMPWMNSLSGAYPGANPITVVAANYGDMMLCYSGSLPQGFAGTGVGAPQLPWTFFAVNLNASKGTVGSVLWSKVFTPPEGNLTIQDVNVDWQTRIFAYQYYETMQWTGFSLTTGSQIWGPTAIQTAFNYYDWVGYDPGVMAYGKLYNGGFGGVTYCYNDKTGALLWTWGNGQVGSGNSTYAGTNTPYGVYPTFIQSIANGVVYLATDEHTITNPIYKGATLEAINATTGQEIVGTVLSAYPSEWAYSGSAFVVADGYLTFFNGYDGQIYSVGRGPSATTVSAPTVGVTTATPIMITGTVLDTSAGTQQSTQKADFPHGVPVSSDASMQAWMGYVYQQQAEPTNFTGVPVQLSVSDSNGNQYPIGTATTNEFGTYALQWTPPIAGNYTIYATFAGTNGYWSSTAVTYAFAGTPQATQAPTATPIAGLATMSGVTTMVAAAAVAIIIAIAIVGLVLARKKQ